MTCEREGIEPDDARRRLGDAGGERCAYVAPELVEYGTVAKLTQSGGGSVSDFGGMMTMSMMGMM